MEDATPYSDMFDYEEYNLLGDLDIVRPSDAPVKPLDPKRLLVSHTAMKHDSPVRVATATAQSISPSPHAEAGRGSESAQHHQPLLSSAQDGSAAPTRGVPLFGRRSVPPAPTVNHDPSSGTGETTTNQKLNLSGPPTTKANDASSARRFSRRPILSAPQEALHIDDGQLPGDTTQKATTGAGKPSESSPLRHNRDTPVKNDHLPALTGTSHAEPRPPDVSDTKKGPRALLDGVKLPSPLHMLHNHNDSSTTAQQQQQPSLNGWHASQTRPNGMNHDSRDVSNKSGSPRGGSAKSTSRSTTEPNVLSKSIQEVKRLVAAMEERRREEEAEEARAVITVKSPRNPKASKPSGSTVTNSNGVKKGNTALSATATVNPVEPKATRAPHPPPPLTTTKNVPPKPRLFGRAPLRPAPVINQPGKEVHGGATAGTTPGHRMSGAATEHAPHGVTPTAAKAGNIAVTTHAAPTPPTTTTTKASQSSSAAANTLTPASQLIRGTSPPPQWQSDYEMDLLLNKDGSASVSLPVPQGKADGANNAIQPAPPVTAEHEVSRQASGGALVDEAVSRTMTASTMRSAGAQKRVVMHATVTDTTGHPAVAADTASQELRARLLLWQNVGLFALKPVPRVNPEQRGGSGASTGRTRARQRMPLITAGRQAAPALEMAGESVEMNYELHNVLQQMRYRNRPLQPNYPAKLPIEMDTKQRTRRPRTPRSFYGKAGPALGADWFKGALDDAVMVDSPDFAFLEAEEEERRNEKKRQLARVGNQPAPPRKPVVAA